MVVHAGAVRLNRNDAMLEDRQIQNAADQFSAWFFRQGTEDVIGIGNAATVVPTQNDVALRLQQTTCPFFRFTQLPGSIAQLFIASLQRTQCCGSCPQSPQQKSRCRADNDEQGTAADDVICQVIGRGLKVHTGKNVQRRQVRHSDAPATYAWPFGARNVAILFSVNATFAVRANVVKTA